VALCLVAASSTKGVKITPDGKSGLGDLKLAGGAHPPAREALNNGFYFTDLERLQAKQPNTREGGFGDYVAHGKQSC